jgi:hypothetical protein
MIAKDLIPELGTRSFVIMKYLLKSHDRRSHPPPQTHFFRVPGAFIADRIIVGRYARYRTPGIAWVTAHDNRGVKAVTHDASDRDGNLQVILRRVLGSPANYNST